jgi:hypothetical protein
MCLFLKKKLENFSKIQALIFLQILLNFDLHLNPNNFFFPKKNRDIL